MENKMENKTLPSVKDLIKDNTASFKYLLTCHDLLIYEVVYGGKRYEFPIPIADLGEATVSRTEKAITLMRYIRKAISDGYLNEYPLEPLGIATDCQIVAFSHYRSNVAYYQSKDEDKNYSFPVRKEDIAELAEDKLYSEEDLKLFESIILKAKLANEYHPC